MREIEARSFVHAGQALKQRLLVSTWPCVLWVLWLDWTSASLVNFQNSQVQNLPREKCFWKVEERAGHETETQREPVPLAMEKKWEAMVATHCSTLLKHSVKPQLTSPPRVPEAH